MGHTGVTTGFWNDNMASTLPNTVQNHAYILNAFCTFSSSEFNEAPQTTNGLSNPCQLC